MHYIHSESYGNPHTPEKTPYMFYNQNVMVKHHMQLKYRVATSQLIDVYGDNKINGNSCSNENSTSVLT